MASTLPRPAASAANAASDSLRLQTAIKPRQRPLIKAKQTDIAAPEQIVALATNANHSEGFSLESLIQRPAVTSHAVLHPDKEAVIAQKVPARVKLATADSNLQSKSSSIIAATNLPSEMPFGERPGEDVVCPRRPALAADSTADVPAPRYSDHNEIYRKIREKEPIGLKELQIVQKNINLLDQEAHIEICRIVLSRKESKYTVNNYGTYIDLNDLDQETLWRIYHYVTFCLEDLERRQVRANAEADMQKQLRENKIFQEMSRLAGNNSHASQNIFHQSQPHYHPGHMPSYEELRQDALRLHQGGEATLPGETEDLRLANEETETANGEEFEMESTFFDAGHGQMGDDFDVGGGGSDSE